MWNLIKKSFNDMMKIIKKGVGSIMSKVINEGKEIVEVVMETPETRNKTGEVLVGLGIGIAILGVCVSDHNPFKITSEKYNWIRFGLNKCGWIFVAASYILPYWDDEPQTNK